MKKMSDVRRQMGEELVNRQSESFESKDSRGAFSGFIDESTGIKTWSAKEGEHIIDIIPYLAGDGNPNPKIKEGTPSYVLILFVHERVGTGNASVICPMRNYGEPCPICDEQKALKDAGAEWNDPAVKLLEPKKKTVYNVICYDTPQEEAKGVQVWVIAHWNFEKHIVELAKATPRGGGVILFADPDKGKSVAFRRKGKGATDTEYLAHKFVDRPEPISDEALEAAVRLEDILITYTYEEIEDMFYGKRGRIAEEAPVTTERNRGGSQTEEAPATSSRMSRRNTAEAKPEESIESQASPLRAGRGRTAPVSDNPCPSGHVYGVDTDKKPECAECSVFDACLDILDAKKKEEAAQAGTSRRLRR